MPELTIKALAEFSTKPIADQMRILAEQKRPSAGAAQFKAPYYMPTRNAVRRYYRLSNNPAILNDAITRLNAKNIVEHKRENNVRAINDFRSHPSFAKRTFAGNTVETHRLVHEDIELRLHPDIDAIEGNDHKYILINYTIAPSDPEIVRRTLELMFWLLSESDITLSPKDCEYFDLRTGNVITNKRAPRTTVLRNVRQNLQVINQLWPII
ncbi:hypothetical protein [Blastopirellula marina]|uniref:Uncharacterized protein n=1 Tax=Blastopirellula marina TaxID=124 RepID=A0A2S8GCQ3_9BACT|nr:hypothetical protein [Blastopirellula marina]PQO42041.1 hypothetical protein C5Y93_27175 [Blastopirellula marina]